MGAQADWVVAIASRRDIGPNWAASGHAHRTPCWLRQCAALLQRTHHDHGVASLFGSDVDVACGGVWLSQRAQRICCERSVACLDEYSAHRTRDHFNWSKRICRDPVSYVQVWPGSASRPWISFWIIRLFVACRLRLDQLGLCTVVRGLPHLAEAWRCSACDVAFCRCDVYSRCSFVCFGAGNDFQRLRQWPGHWDYRSGVVLVSDQLASSYFDYHRCPRRFYVRSYGTHGILTDPWLDCLVGGPACWAGCPRDAFRWPSRTTEPDL